MSNADETFVNFKSLIYRKQPPPLNNTFGVKRENSNVSSFTDDELTPSKKFKKEFLDDQDIMYVGSPREFRRIRSDLLYSKNTILTLENHIQEMHNVRKEMEILFEKERSNLLVQNKRDQKTIEELENQLQSIRKREQSIKHELADMQSNSEKIQLEMNVKIEDLERSYDELKNQKAADNNDKDTEIINLNRKLDKLQKLYAHTLDECDAYKKLVNDLEKKISKENDSERKIELLEYTIQKQNNRIKELEHEMANNQDYQNLAKTQIHKLSKYTEMEKDIKKLKDENDKLKEAVHNKLLLEEEVNDLKGRLITFKEIKQKLAIVQTEQIQNEMYLEEWRSLARTVCEKNDADVILARNIRTMIEHLQQQEINLTSEKVELESQVSTYLHDAKVAKMELEKTRNLLKDMQIMDKQRQNMIHRMQKKISLVSRERDSYRSQLDSYEKDLTICLNPASSGSAAVPQQHQTQAERIANLEKIIEEYRDLNVKLENDLHNIEPQTTECTAMRAEQVHRMKDEMDKLKADNESLRNRKDQLEMQLELYVVGEDTITGRVIHNTRNPVRDYLNKEEAEKQKLQLEVERLKRKIHNMEQGLEASKLNITTPEEINKLREQSRTADIQMQKLTDYFKSSMQEFRNVVYMLLGYKIDKTNSQYKLTSMYAECESDTLYFQLNSEGSLDLLENNFSTTLEELIDLHLRHQKSIPVFLSALTINAFNSSTITATMS